MPWGIDFEGNRILGKDLDLEKLEEEYDAVLLAMGSLRKTRLGVPGEEAPEILPALGCVRKSSGQENP